MEKYPVGPHPRPIQLLLDNRREVSEKLGHQATYTPPSPEHYPHLFLWDSCFSAIVFARYGYCREATEELLTLMDGQRPDGFMPNLQFKVDSSIHTHLEPMTFTDSRVGSDYTQPPLGALAAAEVYAQLQEDDSSAEVFLEEMYPRLKLAYGYFAYNRQNSPVDKLVGIIHPHESGLDSSEIFDFTKMRLPRQGKETPRLINEINRASDYASVMLLNCRLRLKNWSPEEAKEIFWVNDVMFNCVYADNLYEMAGLADHLGKSSDKHHFNRLAHEVEDQVLSDMWRMPQSSDHQGFHALRPDGPIPAVSISNLFPLILPNLQEGQLESILCLMQDSFNTQFPLPSAPTGSPNYDPSHGERDRLWRGPTWINTNWYLVERGLRRQAARTDLAPDLVVACRDWDDRITKSSKELVEQGYFEFYNPETGEPQRTNRVRNFAWSTLADIM